MTHLTVAERLLTWLDVERALKKVTQSWGVLPAGVEMVDCYSDGMDISHTGDENLVKEWLVGIFGRAFDPITEHIALRAGGGQYSVKFQRQAVQAGIKQLTFYPLWRDVAYLSEGAL